jgi:quercetin dioxygenase-like cupin family protein
MSFTTAKSHAFVAAAAAFVASAATYGAMNFVAPSFAQTASNAGTIPLLTQPLPDLPGREVRITLLDRGPGDASPPHHHPGHYTFGYVVEGSYELGIDGKPTRMLKAGDVFYEPPGAIHTVSRNASSDKRLKIVVFMVADQKNPSTVTEH